MKALAPYLSSIVSIIVLVGGFIFTFGRMKEKIVTKENCESKRETCNQNIDQKMENYDGITGKKIDDLKSLVVELHEKTSNRIQEMDVKREEAKDANNEEMKKLNSTIGEVKGALQLLIRGSV